VVCGHLTSLRQGYLPKLLVLVLVVVAILFIQADRCGGSEGYEIKVNVGGTIWEIDRSTLAGTFHITGSSVGIGTYSRYDSLCDSGIAKDERTSTGEGKIYFTEDMKMISYGGPVTITKNIDGDRASITIEEHWPAVLTSRKELMYSGDGIWTRNNFDNNAEVVRASFSTKSLFKVEKYGAVIMRKDLSANIQPGQIDLATATEGSTAYSLVARSKKGMIDLESTGIGHAEYTNLAGNYSITTTLKSSQQTVESKSDGGGGENWIDCLCAPASESTALFQGADYDCIFDV